MLSTRHVLAALAISALISASIGGSGFAAGSQFSDLGATKDKDKIESLHDRGFVQGLTASQFKPDQALTTAEGVQLISGGFQLSLAAIDFVKAPEASDLFAKVPNSAWYAQAFINAHYNHVELPSDLDPKAPLTKEQFTFYLIQGMEQAGGLPMINIKPVDISDEDQLTASYQGAIQRSLTYKVNTLDSSGAFHPKEKITRAEAAVMLYNALEYLKEHQPK
ncbi:S-layer homology domain-containing protein [Paenibacillus sp. HN-1]|uniref:S-layer homology domain-containing protein n=1 Tax=Paenibacillus TaxID=44249 RepID=UPI001CA99727|nr:MULTISPECIES: S-layer homology domain-containing protein [Paenibacillus]MBY9078369.1 S-layer homology domain-containing protein [Paenibacillus sp. CGMCC 1.18879]MBY9087298.1 S-layer homology domain-containing protein [Paenibacillus sinensis]